MKYRFQYTVTAAEIWQLSMYNIYHSMAGLCNVILTVAMILLTVKFWKGAAPISIILMLTGCCLFPIIQPFIIYLRGRKQVARMPRKMELEFGEKGLLVETEGESLVLPWEKLHSVNRLPRMVIIYSSDRHGFMLSKRVLGTEEKAFLSYLNEKKRDVL